MHFQHWGSQAEKGVWTDHERSWRQEKQEKREVNSTKTGVSFSSSEESGVTKAHATAKRGLFAFHKSSAIRETL